MDETPQQRESEGSADAPALRWDSLPVRDDYPRSLLLVGIILAFSVGAAIVLDGPGWGLLSLLVLCAATRRYFLTTTYALDPGGVSVTTGGWTQHRPWSEVRGVYRHRDGVFLSPFSAPSRLDSFRGIYLRYRGNRAEVEAFLDRLAATGPEA